MSRLLYFAYGSNILSERIRERFGRSPIFVNNYTLANFKLEFTGGFGSYANIVPSPGDSVEGCLYQLTDKEIGILDYYEGYPRIYQKHYWIGGQDIIFAYLTKDPLAPGIPSLSYLNIILQGCAERGLERTYNLLNEFKDKNYRIKKKKNFKMNKNARLS